MSGELYRALEDAHRDTYLAIHVSRNYDYTAMMSFAYLEKSYGEWLVERDIMSTHKNKLTELAKEGENKTAEEIAEALEAIVEPVSLYDPVYSDSSSGDNIYIMDQLSDLSSTDEALLEDISLGEALKALSERERKIIDMRFFKGKTQMEIASEIGISQAQVSRLEKGALERMRKHF